MLTLDATLQAAQDGDVHHPIIRLLSSKAVDDIPFTGNVFTSSEKEMKPKYIIHSSGRIIGFNLKYFDANNNHLYMFKTDVDRVEFTIDTPILTNLVPSATGRNIIDFALVELTNGDIGIVYIRLNGSSYELRTTAVDVNGTVKITDYLIVSDTQIKRSVAVLQLPDLSYFLVYNNWNTTWGVQTRTSAAFTSWSSVSNIVASLAVTPINTVYNIPSDFCLLQDGTDLLLFFSYPELLDANNNPLYNVYYSISTNNGVTWGAAASITSYTAFGTTGKYPSAIKSSENALYLSYTEEAGSLVLGYENADWNGGNATGPTYCMLDTAGQKLYVVLGSIYSGTEWQVAAILQIDIATWTVTNKIDYTTVPALPTHFQAQWGSGSQYYFQTQYGNKIVIGCPKNVGVWDAEADTFTHYRFNDNATYGTVKNVQGFSDYDQEQCFISTDENKLYLFLSKQGSGSFNSTLYLGYIDLNDVGPMYTFNQLTEQYVGIAGWPGQGVIKVYDGEYWLSAHVRPLAVNVHHLWCWSTISDAQIYDFTSDPTGISYTAFRDFIKYNGKIYFTSTYKGDTGYENQKGLGIFDPVTEISRFVIPSYKTADDYGFYKLTLNEDLGEIYIGTNVDGVVIFNIASEQFTRLSNDEIPGITPNNTDNFYGNGGGPVYDQANDRFFTCSYGYRAVVSFLRDGKFKQTYYKTGAKTTGWAFSASAQLIANITDFNNWLGIDEDNKIWSFWQKDTTAFTKHYLSWDNIEPYVDITEYVVVDKDMAWSRSINAKANELSFSLSRGHLFDPSNQLSLFSATVKKGRRLTLEAGEKIGGVSYFHNQGTFVITETSLSYSINEYPEINIKAEDKRCIWELDEQISVGYVNEYPEAILVDILQSYEGLTSGQMSIPSPMQGSILIDAQWSEGNIADIVSEICKRFGYFPKITADDIFTLGKISDSNAITHTYSNTEKIIDYTPDDKYSSFVNRIIVTGEERDEIEILFAEERIRDLNGTAGWWGMKKEYTIWYSEDQSRKVRYPRLEKIETAANIAFQLAGSVSESISEEDDDELYCVVKVDVPNLIPQLASAIALYFAGNKIGDQVIAWGGGITIPWGRYIEGTGLFLAMNILGSVCNFQYAIWGQPVGYVRRSVQYTKNDEDFQLEMGKIIPNQIEGFACYTVADCRFVAEFELMVIKMQRKRVSFSKISHLQDEEGDTIQIPHPYTSFPVKLFISDLKRKWKLGENGYCLDEIEGWRL